MTDLLPGFILSNKSKELSMLTPETDLLFASTTTRCGLSNDEKLLQIKKRNYVGDTLEEFQKEEAQLFSSYIALNNTKNVNHRKNLSCGSNSHYQTVITHNQDTRKRKRFRRPYEEPTETSYCDSLTNSYERSIITLIPSSPSTTSSYSIKKPPSSSLTNNSVSQITFHHNNNNSSTTSVAPIPIIIKDTTTSHEEQTTFNFNATLLCTSEVLSFPQELLIAIWLYLTPYDILTKIEYCCKRFLNLSRTHDLMWSILCQRDFSSKSGYKKDIPWRQVYRCRCDKTKINKYKNEPRNIRDLYMDMETALECFESLDIHKKIININKNELEVLQHWAMIHPDRPKPTLDTETLKNGSINEQQQQIQQHDCSPHTCHYELLTEELYLCSKTSLVHVCYAGATCSKVLVSDIDTTSLVCPISGRVSIPKWSDWTHLKGKGCMDVFNTFMMENSSIFNDETKIQHRNNSECQQQRQQQQNQQQFSDDEDEEFISKCQLLQHKQKLLRHKNDSIEEMNQEDEEWSTGGFLGRCFSQGYNCANEKEFWDYQNTYY